jgi:diadenosine tetraphosphate (Ap4A) HIT family hydrolase
MTSYATLTAAQDAKVAPWTDNVPELGNLHVVVFRDAYPVTKGHLLFVPRFNNDKSIMAAMSLALLTGRDWVANNDCDGFNIGLNQGQAAGQTVLYPHVHLIPRNHGDCADPTGGVRGVIFGQQNYKTTGYQKPH